MGSQARGEGGFTIVEVMVAAILFVGGVLAVLAIFISNTKATTSATRIEVATQYAERDLEWMRSIPYECLYMNEIPEQAEEPLPNSRVEDGHLHIGGGRPAEGLIGAPSPLPDCGADYAGVPHGPTAFTIGVGDSKVTGELYRYVTWRSESCPIVDLNDFEDGRSLDSGLAEIDEALREGAADLDGAAGALEPVSGSETVSDAKGTLPANAFELLELADGRLAGILDGEDLSWALANGLDPCSILDVRDLEVLQRLIEVPEALGAYVDALPAHRAQIAERVEALLGGSSSVDCQAQNCSELDADVQGLLDHIAGSGTGGVLDALDEDLQTLDEMLVLRPSGKDTRRIVVAITVDGERGDLLPRTPVWLQSVIIDQSAGPTAAP